MGFFDTVVGWVGQNKAVTILSILLFSFFISTIALAVQKNNLAADLETCNANTPPTPNGLQHRLPSNVVPSHYDLLLHPDLEKQTFTGTVTISFKVTENVQRVILNSFKQTITSVSLLSPTSQVIETTHQLSEEYESLVVTLKSGQLTPTTDTVYKITVQFSGEMSGKNVGLYSSKYIRSDSQREVTISSSKFQPTYARQAFPCFDEPEFKATYNISLVKPNDAEYIALSNMPVIDTVNGPDSNTQTVSFEQSPAMSTYLAVFLVADFKENPVEIENPLGDNFKLTIYLPAGQELKGDFAKNTAKDIIEYYINYFEIEYPLPKLDMAAIPDYVSGATEHWGLVTFRETSLLYDENEGSARNRQRVASVISHELAHMWFGNLVTCKWWNDVWLNEGFASYIEYKGLSVISEQEGWQIDEQFLIEDLHGVMELDSKVASHPITQDATTPDEITSLFDSIAYSKGASIIRMMESFVGNETFKRAVHNFLNDFKYKSVETSDFFHYMDKEATGGINVTEIMTTWINQKGYPVVTVKKLNDNTYELTQERFLLNPDSKADETENSPFRWHIPITYITDVGASEKVEWFKPNEDKHQLNVGSASKWIKVNNKQEGYYIVNYDNWNEIIAELENEQSKFSPSDKAQLLHDAFKLGDSMTIPYNVPLDLSKYLQKINETEYVPWSVATSKFSSLYALLDNSLEFQKYLTQQIVFIYDFVDPEKLDEDTNADHLKKLLREKIMNLACKLGYSKCTDFVRDEFRKYSESLGGSSAPVKPDVDIRQVVYYYGMKEVRNVLVWEKVYNEFLKETDPQERAKLMEALAAPSFQPLLENYLRIAQIKDGPIKQQDYMTVMQYIAYNQYGESIVWDYVRNHWENITDIIDINNRNLGRMIPNITKRFSTQAKLNELDAFFAKYPNAGAGAAARVEARETIMYNINWITHNKATIDNWTIATSKFEPTYARQAFPCFDEPAMKAPFRISIIRPTGDNYISLSNMNEENSEERGNETVSHFAESVPMSTYLACFIVCDFLHKAETVKTQGIGKDFQLKVYATPNQLNKTDFALKTGYSDYQKLQSI
uniref:glutamyl aminopeptidase n=1 Tax=Lutzomyia longipalpis TaxID=7200 RepID=A0A1B0CJN9_LUTLO